MNRFSKKATTAIFDPEKAPENAIEIKVARDNLRSVVNNGLKKTNYLQRLIPLSRRRWVTVEGSDHGTSDSVFFVPERANVSESHARMEPAQYIKINPSEHDDVVRRGDDFEITFLGMSVAPMDTVGNNELLLCSLTRNDGIMPMEPDEPEEKEGPDDSAMSNVTSSANTSATTESPLKSAGHSFEDTTEKAEPETIAKVPVPETPVKAPKPEASAPVTAIAPSPESKVKPAAPEVKAKPAAAASKGGGVNNLMKGLLNVAGAAATVQKTLAPSASGPATGKKSAEPGSTLVEGQPAPPKPLTLAQKKKQEAIDKIAELAELPTSLVVHPGDIPFLHYDPVVDGHDTGSAPNSFVPIPGSKKVYLQRKAAQDRDVFFRFTVMEVDKLSEEQLIAIKSLEAIAKSVSKAASTVPYLKIISSILKFANFLGSSALKKVSEPEHVLSKDLLFLLADPKGAEEEGTGGQRDAYGNYLRVSECDG